MAEAKKQEVASQGKQQASLVVNNAFVDGLVVQLQQKEKFGLTFPKGYNYANELMGAYLILKETYDNKRNVYLKAARRYLSQILLWIWLRWDYPCRKSSAIR